MRPRDRHSRLMLPCLLAIGFTATVARGDWLPNGNPVATITGPQAAPRIAPDGAGGAFVCWDGGFNPHVQRVTSLGNVASGWPATGAAAPQLAWPFTFAHSPVVVGDGRGGAYVVTTVVDGCSAHCSFDPRRVR